MTPGSDEAPHPQHQPRRAAVPAEARRWVAEALGRSPTDVLAARRLPGSTSSVLHEVVVGGVRGRAGAPMPVVLRRYVHHAWRDDAGGLIRTEAAALAAAESAPVAAPRLLAIDPQGERAGDPALLMTRVPGRPQLRSTPGWLGELASIHECLAGWSDSRRGTLPRYGPWFPPEPAVPPWSRQPQAWATTLAMVVDAALPPSEPARPIHRDLHPANILFRRGRAAGVVDWVNACVGPFESDLARCRVNLVLIAGPEAADAFLAAVDHPAARAFDPAWDLVVAVELLPDPVAVTALGALGRSLSLADARRALDDHVARIVATGR